MRLCSHKLSLQTDKKMFEKTKQHLQVVSGGIQVGFRWYSGGIGKTKQLTGNVMYDRGGEVCSWGGAFG